MNLLWMMETDEKIERRLLILESMLADIHDTVTPKDA